MTTSFIELNQSVSSAIMPEFRGLKATATLKDTNEIFPDEVLKVSSSVIIHRSDSSYYSFVFKIDNEILGRLTEFVAESTLEFNLFLIGEDNVNYGVLTKILPVSSYRLDIGAISTSLTITSNVFSLDVIGGDITITKFSKKNKKDDAGAVSYTYEVDPLLFRNIGVGYILTEGNVTMTVVSKNLTLSGTRASLMVGGDV